MTDVDEVGRPVELVPVRGRDDEVSSRELSGLEVRDGSSSDSRECVDVGGLQQR